MKEISIEILNKKKRKRKINWSKLLHIKISFTQYKRPIIKHEEMIKLGKIMLKILNFIEQGKDVLLILYQLKKNFKYFVGHKSPFMDSSKSLFMTLPKLKHYIKHFYK